MQPSPNLCATRQPTSIYDGLMTQLQQSLTRLERRLLSNSPLGLEQFDALREQMAALPLAAEPFSRALNHLKNASRYWSQQEFGAARYEALLFIRQIGPLLSESDCS